MADDAAYVIRLAAWLGGALGGAAPLFEEFTSDELGLELPEAVVHAPEVASALQQAAVGAGAVRDAGLAVESVAGSDDEIAILAAFLRFATEIGRFVVALDTVAVAVSAAATPVTVPDPAARAAVQTFAGALAQRVTEYSLGTAITEATPQFAFVLRLLGLLDWRYVAAAGDSELDRDHVRTSLELYRLGTLFADPQRHLRESLGWGDPAFDPTSLFSLTRDFLAEEADVEVGVAGTDPFLRMGPVRLSRDSSVSPPGLRLAFTAAFTDDRAKRVELNPEWGVGITSDLRLSGEISASLTPPLSVELVAPSATISGGLRVTFDRNEAARPFDLVAGTGLLAVSATNVALGVGFHAEVGSTGEASFEPIVTTDVRGLTLKISTEDADGFIGTLLAGSHIEGQFDLGLEWQASTGLRVTASGGIEIALPVHQRLGPVELQTIYIALRIRSDGTLALETSAALGASLGPLSASVDRVGAELDVRFAERADARFGPFDLALGFKPPNGVGLAVNAGVVSGGGFLSIDVEAGEYAGALELEFASFLALKAIGLITTRMPDGSTGFSLLVVITAEFPGGLQLGYGFKLIGVGGILGLNRGMRLDAIMEGVRTGAIESVMFPHDVVANAPRILSDLKAFFPAEQGRFLIGPMAKLGWGTPTLVSVSLGVIIEIPGNIAILGVLKVALPTEDEAVLLLQVNFAGAIEFDKRRVYFFAALYHSRVLTITIEGEMGLLVAFGDQPDFVLSVGGFHPAFKPPPLPFPSPNRISLNLLNTSVARIGVQGYFAVTSNTAQFGAKAELFFGFSEISVEGHIGFDALFQFSPFMFVVAISAGVSVKVFGLGLFSVSLDVTLTGPTPWEIKGTASISLWFFSIPVDIDVTWGEDRQITQPPVNVLPLLAAELTKPESWRTRSPIGGSPLVNLRALEATEADVVLHPLGTLFVQQRAVPLDIKIDKVGSERSADVSRCSVSVTGSGLVKLSDGVDNFALAQFQDLSDAQKLSLPAFERENAGLELAPDGAAMASFRAVRRSARYEESIIDTPGRQANRFVAYNATLFAHFLGGATITRSPLAQAERTLRQPFTDRIGVPGDAYVVASTRDNKKASPVVFTSQAQARAELDVLLAADPNRVDDLHVIPAVEAVEVAA
jgi:hypothetical protein